MSDAGATTIDEGGAVIGAAAIVGIATLGVIVGPALELPSPLLIAALVAIEVAAIAGRSGPCARLVALAATVAAGVDAALLAGHAAGLTPSGLSGDPLLYVAFAFVALAHDRRASRLTSPGRRCDRLALAAEQRDSVAPGAPR